MLPSSSPRARQWLSRVVRNSEFERRNPALLEHDPVDQERPERHVASAFAAHQLKLMEEGGLSRDAAYDATRDWLIANGRKYLAYMHVDEDEWEELRMPSDPLHSMSPKKMYRELLLRQKQQLKASLAADLKKHAPKVGKWARLTPYRTWRSEEDLYMIQQRLLGGDVTQLARVDTESEGEAEDGADGSGAEYSGGAGAEFVAHSGDGGDGFALDETAGSGDLLDFDEAPADSDGSADGRAGR